MNNLPAWATLNLPRHLALFAGLALFSGIIVRVMITIGVPDHPDPRKSHQEVTPKSGGVGIVASFLLGVLLLYRYGSVSRLAESYFLGVIGAATLMAAIAFLDDLLDLSFAIKLGAQLVAAFVAIGSGLWVHVFALPLFGTVDIGGLGIAVTFLFVLFITNAMNFIDGLNGLAAGVTLITCLILSAIAGMYGAFFVYTASLLLAGGVLGFLPFNFPRARIFMGDVGSQFCGFMLALFGIAAARYETTPLSFLLVPLLLSGVLFDVAFTLVRRALAGESLPHAHRGHLYQVAQRSGMDARLIALLHWAFVGVGGMCAAGFMLAPKDAKPLILLVPLLIQIAWAAAVARRARLAGIAKW